MRAKDLVKGNIAYHEELNPAVWDDGHALRLEVRYKLLEIAKRFIEYLEVPNFKLSGILLRGSLANYNYTAYSDFDLHLVTNYADLGCDITEQFYMAKKKIWNDEHDITIKGYEVELYVEDINAKNVSAGTYNVLDDKWVSVPTHEEPSIDDRAVSAKARDLIAQINRAIKTGSVEDLDRLKDKIKTMRQAGLDAGGEFSTENLAFKILRNKGYMDKLYKSKTQKFDQELSLDEELVSEKWTKKYKDSINCSNPKGFSQKAHCAGKKKHTNENFADGKKPGRKGLAKRSGVDCKQSVSKLRSIAAHSTGEKQRMAHWCANMKSGKKK